MRLEACRGEGQGARSARTQRTYGSKLAVVEVNHLVKGSTKFMLESPWREVPL